MKYLKNKNKKLNHWLSIPFIYPVFIPMLILHIFTELYHQICFRLYGISLINYRNYIKVDRHKLNYLSLIQKINCMYCGYMNGTIEYIKRIINETEVYWCGIAHNVADNSEFITHKYHDNFLKYGDKVSFCKLIDEDIEYVDESENKNLHLVQN